MLTILDNIPPKILQLKAGELHEALEGPTLLHLEGKRQPAVFVSVLLHGNEDSGFEAVKQLLLKHQGQKLPRSLSIFIGNVAAAKYNLRRLDQQPDFNRIWLPGPTPEHAMTQQILEEMRGRGVFASVDIHNNTGVNPHYACVNRLNHRFYRLAMLYSRTVVYFTRPEGVQTMAFAELGPAVTLECGKVDDAIGIAHARDYLEACLHLSEIPDTPVPVHDLDLFHTVASIKIPEHRSIGFGQEPAEIRLMENLDHLNFTELPAGTVLGWVQPGSGARLIVSNETGLESGHQYFCYDGDEIRTKLPIMPSMFTLNKQIIRQDCMGYIMERIELPG